MFYNQRIILVALVLETIVLLKDSGISLSSF